MSRRPAFLGGPRVLPAPVRHRLIVDTLMERHSTDPQVVGWDFHGHQHSPAALDAYLSTSPSEARWGPLASHLVSRSWRIETSDGIYLYHPRPVVGAAPVTHVMVDPVTWLWCFHHPTVPAVAGHPLGQFPTKVTAEHQRRRQAGDRRLSAAGRDVGLLYLCDQCHQEHQAMIRAARPQRSAWRVARR